MLRFFRGLSNSRIGTWAVALIGIGILVGFAMGDLSNVGTGNLGFGMGSSTLAEAGKQEVTDREMSDAMQRRLQEVRQQNPTADYTSIAADFEPLLAQLIDQAALFAFADKYGFHLSKRLIDGEIAQIPGTRGLDGKFSEQAYAAFLQQQRMTDAQVREVISTGVLQRLLLTPIAVNARTPVGVATPYASMLLEAREGEAVVVPVTAFTAGLKPTDADLQRYYAANRARYMVPEQRVIRIARMGPEQVANVSASDQEIAAYYRANQATYGARETRTLSQAIVPDRAAANAIAARARAGGTLAAAAAPAGSNASVSSLADQTRQAYASVAGERAAAAAFGAASGAVVGPIQSDFGWVVVKVDAVKREGGKSLDQARSEIAAKLNAEKRKAALEELVDRVQTALDEGRNFAEAASQAKLPVTTTPLIVANGTSRTDSGYKFPAELAPALKVGFEMASNDQPEIATLPNDQGYAMVAPEQVVAAAPAPLASIRDRVEKDWVLGQALARARTVANSVAAKASTMPLSEAVQQAGIPLPPVRPIAARRIQIAEASGQIAPPLRMLFTLGAGKSRAVRDVGDRGFFVVKVDKIVPGNALLQPGLIGQMQNELQQATSQDYAQQFIAALRAEVKVQRNEKAIQEAKQRLTSGGG
jgi:peptidyl-prolyl cis-trans isomerase D